MMIFERYEPRPLSMISRRRSARPVPPKDVPFIRLSNKDMQNYKGLRPYGGTVPLRVVEELGANPGEYVRLRDTDTYFKVVKKQSSKSKAVIDAILGVR